MATRQTGISSPAPQGLHLPQISPRSWAIFALIALAIVVIAGGIMLFIGSEATSSTQAQISALPVGGPAAASNAPASAPAANTTQIQRLGPADLRNTPEAQLGQKAMDGAFPYAFTDTYTGAAALQACRIMFGKKIGGGNPTNTILEGTKLNGAIASITWRHDLRSSSLSDTRRTTTGTITLNFTRVAGEPKISSVSC